MVKDKKKDGKIIVEKGIVLLRNIPLIYVILLYLLLLIYQFAIGNLFLESIDPRIIVSLTAIMFILPTFPFLTYKIYIKDRKLYITWGIHRFIIPLEEIEKIERVQRPITHWGVVKKGEKINICFKKGNYWRIIQKNGIEYIISTKSKNFEEVIASYNK